MDDGDQWARRVMEFGVAHRRPAAEAIGYEFLAETPMRTLDGLLAYARANHRTTDPFRERQRGHCRAFGAGAGHPARRRGGPGRLALAALGELDSCSSGVNRSRISEQTRRCGWRGGVAPTIGLFSCAPRPASLVRALPDGRVACSRSHCGWPPRRGASAARRVRAIGRRMSVRHARDQAGGSLRNASCPCDRFRSAQRRQSENAIQNATKPTTTWPPRFSAAQRNCPSRTSTTLSVYVQREGREPSEHSGKQQRPHLPEGDGDALVRRARNRTEHQAADRIHDEGDAACGKERAERTAGPPTTPGSGTPNRSLAPIAMRRIFT